ncbi:MAG: DUF983 domain-containing protein [Alphaproteobacteria bacterium]|nr:DUF983 domain-containing protein [Alphaproteobacteria bacterium]
MTQTIGNNFRSWRRAMGRGLKQRCPACGQGAMYGRFLKVRDECQTCGLELHHHRADDAPPYFTMMIVGHIIVPLVLILERTVMPSLWLQFFLWLPLTLILCLIILPRVKGALIGLQWAHRMHGFGEGHD